MNAYNTLNTGQGKLSVSAYLSARDRSAFEVKVQESSLMALLTSIIQIAESIKNMIKTMAN